MIRKLVPVEYVGIASSNNPRSILTPLDPLVFLANQMVAIILAKNSESHDDVASSGGERHLTRSPMVCGKFGHVLAVGPSKS